jgi:hypothetical protein
MGYKMLWTPDSNNTKTGSIPTAWIGATPEETRASCEGCALLNGGCYSHSGTGKLAAASIQRASRAGADRSLRRALHLRRRTARFVRISAIGDAGRVDPLEAIETVRMIRAEGLAIIGYTHHWREPGAAVWKGILRASVDNAADADEALAAGWTVATILPADASVEPGALQTPGGAPIRVCPNQVMEKRGRLLQCNECLLCARGDRPVIGFLAHGNGAADADRAARLDQIATLDKLSDLLRRLEAREAAE